MAESRRTRDPATTIHNRPTTMGGEVKWSDTPRTKPRFHGNVEALKRDLRREVRGEVRFDSQARALYATDASNYRQVPMGVVLPLDKEDLVAAVRVCSRHGAPLTHRGGGTSLAGQAANAAVVIDSSRHMTRILEIDPDKRMARVEPGVVRDRLTERSVAEHGLTFAPDTSTHAWATFGGMIGNNSCGVHSEMAGKTVDNVEELEVLLYDGTRLRVGATTEDELESIIAEGGRRGELYAQLKDLRNRYSSHIRDRYRSIPRRISGYNLDELLPERGFHVARALVGSEGTLATILEATVRLVPDFPHRALLVLGYNDVFEAGDHVSTVKQFSPIGLEGMDDRLLHYMHEKNLHVDHLSLLPEGEGFLLVEFGGHSADEAVERANECRKALEKEADPPSMRLVDDLQDQENLWTVRESGLGATAHLPEGDTFPGWEDSAVPPESIGEYMRDLRALYESYGYEGSVYGHFGQGCVHSRIGFDLLSEDGLADFRNFIDDASDLCLKYGGSLSAEHGDGQARAELLPKMYGRELLEAFREFKSIWDPEWKMNPGKVVDPYRIDQNLRMGPAYDPPELETHFAYPADNGSFSKAVTRCVGVGKCRNTKLEGAEVMCPSYVATRDETHSTRGRARLLFEMLNGEETADAWRNEDVHDALDLCLSCKGCKNDCPVDVDMATYKAEFLSHYYRGRVRPRQAYAFGLISVWSRLASIAPRVVNFLTHAPGLAEVAKFGANVAQERDIPTFANQTFRGWFFHRPKRPTSGERVILFPDTFHNFMRPHAARAAVEVLEDAGFEVVVPEANACCGRPLYEFGFLDMARRFFRDLMATMKDEIRSGVPIVCLEPSCTATFRDELVEMLPDDENARQLSSNTYTLAEFLTRSDYQPPRLDAQILLHGHCHQKSIMGIDPDYQVLDSLGVEYDLIESGCCGMAGGFGFEKEHYDVSIACGEYRLLPEVRGAPPETIILADGFSCQEQIRQTTEREALHLAEVLHMAHFGDGRMPSYPERPYVSGDAFAGGDDTASPAVGAWLAGGAVAATAGAALYRYFR